MSEESGSEAVRTVLDYVGFIDALLMGGAAVVETIGVTVANPEGVIRVRFSSPAGDDVERNRRIHCVGEENNGRNSGII